MLQLNQQHENATKKEQTKTRGSGSGSVKDSDTESGADDGTTNAGSEKSSDINT